MLDGRSHSFFGALVHGQPGPDNTTQDRIVKTGQGTLVVPQHCPVRLDDQTDPSVATFTGRFLMTGIWRFAWLDDESYDLVFEPDAQSLAALPHWKQTGTGAVVFDNAHEFLATILTHQARNRLRFRRQLTVYGRATIMADHLATACQNGWLHFQVRFLGAVTAAATEPQPAAQENSGG